MCYAIGVAASKVEEFFLLPINNKLFEYSKLGINTIVVNKNGDINSCDIPFNNNLTHFNNNYTQLTQQVVEFCNNYEIDDAMIIGTSALAQYELEGVVNFYSGIYNNPFVIWSKYKKSWLKKYLIISFQFHHVQMDGAHANEFLNELQKAVDAIK
jgi:Chloramphenicol O-acetyltransferase